MTTTWEGRVAVVTGAGSGIGQATAQQLLDAGASVVGVDLTDESLAWLAEHERGAALAGDVSTQDCNTAMVECATSRFGGLHSMTGKASTAAGTRK